MKSSVDRLDLEQPLVDLFRHIVDIESVSGFETRLADALESALRRYPHLSVDRDQDAVVARTNLGRARRVVIAGHIDTVPVADNLPSSLGTVDGVDVVFGRGTCDMKGGVAVAAQLAATLTDPRFDVTWVFYDHEEVAAELNGLGRLVRLHPDWVRGDFAVLMEPTSANVEGGCQGTTRFLVTCRGVAAHSARSWLGDNAIHRLADVIERIRRYRVGEVVVDGLTYREGINATVVSGGVAGNVIPDTAQLQVNYRFAPSKTTAQVQAAMVELFDGYEVEFLDLSPAARPGLDQEIALEFVAAVNASVGPKYGWTDVARFAELGIPAVNYGPADPGKAHTVDEFCPVADLHACLSGLKAWLSSPVDSEN